LRNVALLHGRHLPLDMTRLALLTALLLLPAASMPHAAAADAAAMAAKGGSGFPPCAQCHGANGEGQPGTGFPRLAGQVERYLVKQLEDFRAGRRENPVMAPIAKALPDDAVQALSAYYAKLRTGPAAPVAAKAGTAGDGAAARLARKGNWDENVPACFACHGENGAGIPPHFPAIAGQRREYTAKQIRDWKAGTRANDPQGLMKAVSGRLADAEIDAVAAYLEQLQ
jgi:cytochrome c553